MRTKHFGLGGALMQPPHKNCFDVGKPGCLRSTIGPPARYSKQVTTSARDERGQWLTQSQDFLFHNHDRYGHTNRSRPRPRPYTLGHLDLKNSPTQFVKLLHFNTRGPDIRSPTFGYKHNAHSQTHPTPATRKTSVPL